MDEICPDTLEEMRQNDGKGSDNMTIICVDLLMNKGGSNALTRVNLKYEAAAPICVSEVVESEPVM